MTKSKKKRKIQYQDSSETSNQTEEPTVEKEEEKKENEPNIINLIDFSKNKKIKVYEKISEKISELNVSDEFKTILNNKLNSCNLDEKREVWFDNLFNIPFGIYSKLSVNKNDSDELSKYFFESIKKLNTLVYGMEDVKEEIINYLAQCFTNNSSPRVIGLHGPAGSGKTKIIRGGISNILNRPLKTFSMGGITDSQYILGFDHTYSNSRNGAICQALTDCKVMDPIFFFDELDKVSDTNDGRDIQNTLIHLTDPIQNNDFKDKYFEGIPIDLSKAIFIFAFNDIDRVNPVLRDRIHVIKIKGVSENDKINIVKNYLIDELIQNTCLTKNDFSFSDSCIKLIIRKYSETSEGMRSVKKSIESILLKLNTIKLLGNKYKNINLPFYKNKIEFPILLTEKNIDIFFQGFKYNCLDERIQHLYT